MADIDKLESAVYTFFYTIFAIALVVMFIVAIVVLAKNSRRNKKGQKKFGKGEFLFMGKFPILAGLHLPEGALCEVYCLKSRIVIEASGQEFSLPVNRIVDVSTMKKTDVQKQYVSDAGGAVAGGMMFGPLGAMLGGGVHQKTILNTSKFLMFTYKDNDTQTMRYLVFSATERMDAAKKFTDAFKPLKQRKNVKIDL